MSASTVSVTANPRRRTSAVSDVKQGIDIVNDAGVSPNFENNNTNNKNVGGDGGGERVGSGNKDLSHSIRGESVLERSKEKKSCQLPNSNVALRGRNQKAAAPAAVQQKQPKARWQTVRRVLFKNVLLFLVLVGLVQMIRKLAFSSGNMGAAGSLMGFSDMEGRIAGVETSLKTTAKMLQVQVEVVDKKIESEVGNLRREVNRKIDDKSGEIDGKLRKLEERSESLEMGMVELRSKELLTKEDVVRLYDELKRGESGGDVGGVSLDEIRGVARDIVEKEIEKHAADGLGKVDYALATGGGKVVQHSAALVETLGSWLPGSMKQGVHRDANNMLRPSFGEPGNCFPLKGTSGYVVIRLRSAIVPEAITLEHVAESVAFDRSSAPKHCRVSGWFQGHQGLETQTVDGEKMFLLTDIIYDLEKTNAQTFDVLDQARASVIDTVRFDFGSNHGNSAHTCIYRLRVHGHEPKSVPVIPADS